MALIVSHLLLTCGELCRIAQPTRAAAAEINKFGQF
jgi:hypothetical protein